MKGKSNEAFLAAGQKSTSSEFRRLNPQLFGGSAARQGAATPSQAEKGPEIATKAKKAREMTRTEIEYEAILKREHPGCEILFERYTLKLSNDCRYVVDFSVVHPDRTIDHHEVKGAYLFRGATKSATASSLTKPKTAKELFPWHRFFRATKAKDGTWSREEYHAA